MISSYSYSGVTCFFVSICPFVVMKKQVRSVTLDLHFHVANKPFSSSFSSPGLLEAWIRSAEYDSSLKILFFWDHDTLYFFLSSFSFYSYLNVFSHSNFSLENYEIHNWNKTSLKWPIENSDQLYICSRFH